MQLVTPMEVTLAETDSDMVANPECTDNLHTVAGVEKGEPPQESNDVMPEVDMSGLTSEQQEVVRKMLKEEAASFAKNEDNIGCIEGLQMDIDLSNRTPVQQNYVPIPRPLYQEVESYNNNNN